MKARLRIATMGLFALALCWRMEDRAWAFSYYQVGGQNVIWQGHQSIRYLSPGTFPVNSDPDLQYRAAMASWSVVPKALFTYYFIRNTQEFPIDNYDGYSDTAAVPASQLDPGVLGVTYLVNNGRYWYDMDMVFSDLPEGVGYTFDLHPTCDVLANPTPSNGFSFILVALHELGHALGLGHDPIGNESPGTPWFIATMNPRYPTGGPVGQQNIIELHTDDRAGCRFLYPYSGQAQPPYVDLASAEYTSSATIGQAVPLFFSQTTAVPGGIITMRSVIENFGSNSQFDVSQGFYLSTNPTIETSDTLLGSTLWDIAFEDGFEFDADVDLPADLAAGTYYVGTILDNLNQITEVYEDNNAASYCTPLTISRLAPVVNLIPQQNITCGVPFNSVTAAVTKPLNMSPITWSLDNPPSGMTINASTGQISWSSPIASPFPYVIIVRATNSSGTDTEFLFLGVGPAAPQIVSIPNASLCKGSYTGPTPQITSPACMNPIINWSIDAGPPGMTINNSTGVVSWPSPTPSSSPYTITIRATNGAGNGTQTWQLSARSIDIDANSIINDADAAAFADVLVGADTNPTHVSRADQNFDGNVNGLDVKPFVECYLSP